MHVATIRNVLGYPNIGETVRIVGDTVHSRLLVEEAVVRRRVTLRQTGQQTNQSNIRPSVCLI
jgi:hypothetical protein